METVLIEKSFEDDTITSNADGHIDPNTQLTRRELNELRKMIKDLSQSLGTQNENIDEILKVITTMNGTLRATKKEVDEVAEVNRYNSSLMCSMKSSLYSYMTSSAIVFGVHLPMVAIISIKTGVAGTAMSFFSKKIVNSLRFW